MEVIIKNELRPNFIVKNTPRGNFIGKDNSNIPNKILFIKNIGPQGIAGAAASQYDFEQVSPLTTWTINHNLNKVNVDTTVFSTGGVEIEANVININSNMVQVNFNTPTSGRAICQ